MTCGDCMALVLAEKYGGRCDQYCESFGQVCIRAAEEQDENCEVGMGVILNIYVYGVSMVIISMVFKFYFIYIYIYLDIHRYLDKI